MGLIVCKNNLRRPTQMFVSTDADVRIDRRRRTHRPTRMLVTTDADGVMSTCSG
ncbi:hypothetical protein [Leyella stercorea]|uniref:hypothetical protein n=1 Tax=Leyella stercorea TaxID=363265 RepID=UPI0024305908|nr:hypothetical protein [Leyella stercorea]